MKSIAQYQRDLLHTIAQGDLNPDARTRAHLKDDTVDRFSVYVAGFRARIEASLLEAFPATERFLGHEHFHRLSAEYARVCPSIHWDLSHAGYRWAEFLASQPVSREFPFVPELAWYEWVLHMTFFAFDAGSPAAFPDDMETLAAWRPKFSSTVRIFQSAWPVLELRDAAAAPENWESLQAKGAPHAVLVGRSPGGEVMTLALTENQRALQAKLLAGDSLGEAMETLPSLAETEIASLSGFWVGQGLLR